MTKEQVIHVRDELFKDKPMIIVLDNEHNFFDNYPDSCYPVWDDDNELVLFVESNQEHSGMASSDFPFVVAVAAYEYIQSIRVVSSMSTAINFTKDNKVKLGDDKYDYNMKCLTKGARNTRPAHRPYFK